MEAKDYEELSFTDDFMFGKVLQTHPDICRELIELILNVKIKVISFPDVQKSITITSDGKGIRFDAYVEDDRNTVYDVEMQTTDNKNLPKRSRYYQGMVDLNLIEKGENYNKLKSSYIIFICLKDPFDAGRHIYTFENRCREDNNIILGDEAQKVFLNAAGTIDDVSEEMKNFLEFLKTGREDKGLPEDIAEAVKKVKSSEEWRTEYMTLLMRDKENIEKGIEQGKYEAFFTAVSAGKMSSSDAAGLAGIPVPQFEKRMEEAGYKSSSVR